MNWLPLSEKNMKIKGIDNQVFSINLYGSTCGTPVICMLPFAELCFINRLVQQKYNLKNEAKCI